jgi:hypothetical protein
MQQNYPCVQSSQTEKFCWGESGLTGPSRQNYSSSLYFSMFKGTQALDLFVWYLYLLLVLRHFLKFCKKHASWPALTLIRKKTSKRVRIHRAVVFIN